MSSRKRFKYKLKAFKRDYFDPIHVSMRNKSKVFCIGLNKTGTTSIGKALEDLGYILGDEVQGQKLMYSYSNRNLRKIAKFCRTAEAFQDTPFSLKYTFIVLDNYFDNARFILSVRDSAEEWYQSLVKFHTKLLGKREGNIPKYHEMRAFKRPFNRNLWMNMQEIYDVDKDNPYNEDKLISYYCEHNAKVKDYFKNKNNIVVINLKNKNSYKKMCAFLGTKPKYNRFPWLNKTTDK